MLNLTGLLTGLEANPQPGASAPPRRPTMLLIGFEEGVKCAEVPIDDMPNGELKIILDHWDNIGRTYEYHLEERFIKPYKWPEFKAEEVEDGK